MERTVRVELTFNRFAGGGMAVMLDTQEQTGALLLSNRGCLMPVCWSEWGESNSLFRDPNTAVSH